MLVISATVCLAVACAFLSIHEEARRLAYEARQLPRSGLVRAVQSTPAFVALELPPFSTQSVVKTFNSIAEDVHVPLDEVTYVLESASDTPYQRYRITLSAKAAYPEIRKFVAVLAFDMPNMALDSIRCVRPDPAAGTLGCELAFSAFFTKPEHG